MENQYSNNTLQNDSYANESYVIIEFYIVFWISASMCLPLLILAIYSLYSLVRQDHTLPIYIINLLIADLIQFCSFGMKLYSQTLAIDLLATFLFYSSLMSSVGFMVCVSLERYLLIAWPLWYRFRRTITVSVVVCVMVWVSALLINGLCLFNLEILDILFIFLLLPFPVLIFSLVGTFRALSAAISVSTKEKRRIIGSLILVLLNYTLLFLPLIVALKCHHQILGSVSGCLIQLNPLADMFLYVFMRKDAKIDKLLASLCFCIMDKQSENEGVNGENEEIKTEK